MKSKKINHISYRPNDIRLTWIKKECDRLGITKQEVLNRLIDASTNQKVINHG